MKGGILIPLTASTLLELADPSTARVYLSSVSVPKRPTWEFELTEGTCQELPEETQSFIIDDIQAVEIDMYGNLDLCYKQPLYPDKTYYQKPGAPCYSKIEK